MSTTAQTTTAPLALRPWPTKEEDDEPLKDTIQRINTQRGHFRNVNEAQLEQEVRAAEADDVEDKPEEEDNVNDLDARRKELSAAKAEMIKFLGQAHNEALTALDFISLLASRDAPRRSEQTISPALKEMTPAGTMGYDQTNASKPTTQDEENEQAVVLGWNAQNIETTANALLDKAQRLEEEMEKEARYWEQVLSVKENGWSVCRLPQEKHTIGVRFGFSEAGPTFSNQGLAALRPSADGSIVLDRGLSRPPKVVRLRMRHADGRNETSTLPSQPVNIQNSIGAFIYQARDSLFEEELFHEVTREARSLQSYGAKIVDDVIHMSTDTDDIDQVTSSTQILIDLVSPELLESGSQEPGPSIATAVALSLRLYLTHIYRRKFNQRSRPPPPLTIDKKPPEVYQLLRPILSHLQHHTTTTAIATFLQSLTTSLRSAKLPASLTITSTTPDLTTLSSSVAKNPLVDSLLDILSRPLTTTHNLHLSASTSLNLTTTTHFSAPSYGTSYTLSTHTTHAPSAIGPAFNLTTIFTRASELRAHIEYLCTREIGATIGETTDLGWRTSDAGSELRRSVSVGVDAAANESGSGDANLNMDGSADEAHDGSNDTDGKQTRTQEWKLVVKVKDGRIMLAAGGAGGQPALAKVWLWHGERGRERGLLEVVRAYMGQLELAGR